MPLRLLLAATVAVLREGRDADELAKLDGLLGLVELDDDSDDDAVQDDDDDDDPFAEAEQAESDRNRAALLMAGYGQIVSG